MKTNFSNFLEITDWSGGSVRILIKSTTYIQVLLSGLHKYIILDGRPSGGYLTVKFRGTKKFGKHWMLEETLDVGCDKPSIKK